MGDLKYKMNIYSILKIGKIDSSNKYRESEYLFTFSLTQN